MKKKLVQILTSRHKLTTLEISILGILGLIVSVASVASLHVARVPDHDLLVRAAQAAERGFSVAREARIHKGIGIDSINDPALSGLIGPLATAITTGPGDLEAKQTSVNPNWAALILRYLQKAGVTPGDPVAVGMTGSFPAMNIAVLTAIESYGAQPIWTVSQGSTSFGANRPGFTWLDIEKSLFEKRVISSRALAATLGGSNNIGAGLDDTGRAMLRESITSQTVPLIDATPLSAAIETEMAMFGRASAGKRIRLYINIGSGYTSLGTMNTAPLLTNGMNSPARLARLAAEPVRGVAAQFLSQGAQVLNIYDVISLARNQSLPIAPAVLPSPGTGKLFMALRYTWWLNVVLLLVYSVIVLAFAFGYTNFLTKNPRKKEML